jgi:hypothetical protein
VVIAIIGILVALLLPAVQAARESARRTQCLNNLKQIALAVQNFHDTYKELPPSRWRDKHQTWMALAMPYLEAANEYDMWDFSKPYADPTNKQARMVLIPGYFCPSRRTPGGEGMLSPPVAASVRTPQGSTGDYAGNTGEDLKGAELVNGEMVVQDTFGVLMSAKSFVLGDFIPKSFVSFEHITDGLSKTFLVGEKQVPSNKMGIDILNQVVGDASIYNGDYLQNHVRPASHLWPPAPEPEYGEPCGENGSTDECDWHVLFGSSHPGVVQFGLCDGSVHVINRSINLETYRRLAVRNDGFPVDLSSE